jgi:dephospho-CoA kinase
VYRGKPIIGLTGGIGAGKTFVGNLFAEMGCLSISSDALVRDAYTEPEIKRLLRDWWGDDVFGPSGEVDRSAIARRIFDCVEERQRLEGMLHPQVDRLRQAMMDRGAADERVVAYVWDTPLLFESGLSDRCDAIVFVDAPAAVRLKRLQENRGWDTAELSRRENSQLPMDKKRQMSDYTVVNATDAGSSRVQVRELLSRILAGAYRRPISGRVTPA